MSYDCSDCDQCMIDNFPCQSCIREQYQNEYHENWSSGNHEMNKFVKKYISSTLDYIRKCIAQAIIESLKYLYVENIMHRDLHTEILLINGPLVISDFGLTIQDSKIDIYDIYGVTPYAESQYDNELAIVIIRTIQPTQPALATHHTTATHITESHCPVIK